MKRSHYHYFEVTHKKVTHKKAYLLYDQENLVKLDSPSSIGGEREVKLALSKLPKETIMSYYEIKDIKLTKDGAQFTFTKILKKVPEIKEDKK